MSLFHFQQMVTLKSGAIALLVYLASLILTLSTTELDDKLSLHKHNETVFELMEDQVKHSKDKIYNQKKIPNVWCHCVLIISTWMPK